MIWRVKNTTKHANINIHRFKKVITSQGDTLWLGFHPSSITQDGKQSSAAKVDEGIQYNDEAIPTEKDKKKEWSSSHTICLLPHPLFILTKQQC